MVLHKGDIVFWKVGRNIYNGRVFDTNPSIAPGSVGVIAMNGEFKGKTIYPLKKYVKSYTTKRVHRVKKRSKFGLF